MEGLRDQRLWDELLDPRIRERHIAAERSPHWGWEARTRLPEPVLILDWRKRAERHHDWQQSRMQYRWLPCSGRVGSCELIFHSIASDVLTPMTTGDWAWHTELAQAAGRCRAVM